MDFKSCKALANVILADTSKATLDIEKWAMCVASAAGHSNQSRCEVARVRLFAAMPTLCSAILPLFDSA